MQMNTAPTGITIASCACRSKCKRLMIWFRISPNTTPTSSDSASAAARLNSSSEIASSMPTTASSVVVSSPPALCSVSTSIVAAGAVAEASAPKISAV